MSELAYYLSPKPALEPIETRGNWFWRGGERFLIKGINYFLRDSGDGNAAIARSPKVDCLADERLDDLCRDIALFHELRLNTVLVSSLDPSNNHDKALKLLAEAGIYVLVTIGENIPFPDLRGAAGIALNQHTDMQPYYTRDLATRTLQLVDQLADQPNILGFMVSGNSINNSPTTKSAEIIRALIRDVKIFLNHRGGRQIPVGVHNRELMMHRKPALEYFTAGPPSSRADFFALESWTWANPSSFQISGWKNMVQNLGAITVPMFLSEFGTYVGRTRTWEEVSCLFSPEMTGVFSGGCAYTLYEYGDCYGLVEGDGSRKEEFELLKGQMRVVAMRSREELWTEEGKDWEGWRGEFPEVDERRWLATSRVPEFPLDRGAFLQRRSGEARDMSEDPESTADGLSRQIADMNINKT